VVFQRRRDSRQCTYHNAKLLSINRDYRPKHPASTKSFIDNFPLLLIILSNSAKCAPSIAFLVSLCCGLAMKSSLIHFVSGHLTPHRPPCRHEGQIRQSPSDSPSPECRHCHHMVANEDHHPRLSRRELACTPTVKMRALHVLGQGYRPSALMDASPGGPAQGP